MHIRSVRTELFYGAAISAILWSGVAQAQQRDFDIPAENAIDAIPEFAQQASVQVITSADQIKGVKTPGVRGSLDARAALKRLLAGTGLEVASDDGQIIVLRSVPKNVQAAQNDGAARNLSSTSSTFVETVLVTAQKDLQDVRDVPVPVTVLNGDRLAEANQDRLRDYFDTIPGLNINPTFAGAENVTIRGISAGGLTTPTVGTAIDGIPIGATSGSHGNDLLEIDPADLARIEVLRGPQGTLYGADSMGGLINFVTADPSTSEYSGRLEAGTSSVSNGTQPGFTLRGSVNVPIDDTLAFRASAFVREDPGFINDPIYNLKSVNSVESSGAHLSVLWQPNDAFSIKMNGLYNRVASSGLDEAVVAPGLGTLDQNYLPGSGYVNTTVQAVSIIVKGQLKRATITSTTGYNVIRNDDGLNDDYFYGGGVNALEIATATTKKVSQELRIETPVTDNLKIMVGGFYTHEWYSGGGYQDRDIDPATGQTLSILDQFVQLGDGQYDEAAIFGNLTYQITDRFDVQFGARESWIQVVTPPSSEFGTFDGPAPILGAGASASPSAFTYLVTPRWKIGDDIMVYARVASGYRPGTPNIAQVGIPPLSTPDKTKNYEIGTKSDFWDQRVSLDLSLYHIDWSNIQIQLRGPTGFVYTANGADAESDGVEASLVTRPLDGLTVSGWFAYNDAQLTQSFPAASPAVGLNGDRLPLSSKYSADVSANYQFPISHNLMAFVGGDLAYIGDRIGVFGTQDVPQRQYFPAYTKLNLQAGFMYDTWRASLYVNNLSDERALVNGGFGYFNPDARVYITPRTVGLNIQKIF